MLKSFYDNNKRHFSKDYWKGLTRERFVLDVRGSVPIIFDDFTKCFETRKLYDHFEPLDKYDERTRRQNETRLKPHELVRLKSKYGYICNKIAFRLYAIEIDDDCFIITGGAIKIEQDMNGAGNTKLELKKLNYLKDILQKEKITSKQAFLDYIKE